MYDVFISFSFEDRELVDKIVNELTNIYHIPCWICTAEVRAGSKFYEDIVKAIDECKILLFVQTKSSAKSSEVKDEIFEALAKEKTIIPFVIDDSVLDGAVNFKLRNTLAIKATEPPIENRIAELAEELCRILDRPFFKNSQTENTVKQDGLKNIMPLNNYNFIGRYNEMQLLEDYLERDRVVILHGFGGSGKTEIAKKYVFENKLKYDSVIFTNYTSTLTDILISDKYFCFENISRSSDGNQPESDESYAGRKLAELKKRATENTLIIVDNFDTLTDDLLSDFLDGPYKLIFTTRTNFDFLGVPMVEITALNPDEQMELFSKNYKLKLTEDVKETIREIIEEIGGHTLTLELIAKLMYIRRIKPCEMLLKLQKHGVSGEIEGKVQHGLSKVDSVYSHIRTLFRLETLSESGRNILNNLSLLPFAGVKFDDFLTWSGLENTEEIYNLVNCGFIRYDEENDVLSLHPVVSDVVNNDENFDIKSCSVLIKNLADIFGTTYNMERGVRAEYGEIAKFMSKRIIFDKDNLHICKQILNILMDLNYNSMFEELLEQMHSVTGEEDSEDYGWYLYKLGDYKLRNMNYDEAIENLQKSIEIYSRVSPDSTILGNVIKHLAHTYHAVFLHVENNNELLIKARQCLNDSGEIFEKCTDPISPYMGSQYYAVALNHYYFGEYEPAMEYAQKSFEIFMEIGGEINSNTTAPMRVLARVYSKIGMFKEAVEMQNRVISARKKLWGEKNFSYIEQFETLADIYFDNGMKEKGLKNLEYILTLINDNQLNMDFYADKIRKRISLISDKSEKGADNEQKLQHSLS